MKEKRKKFSFGFELFILFVTLLQIHVEGSIARKHNFFRRIAIQPTHLLGRYLQNIFPS